VRKFGYEPLVAEGGDAAAAMLTGEDGAHIDAVVLDLVMPDLDGLGVLAKMREAGLATPVIVQTAHGGIDNVVTAIHAGATDFVVKPVGAERLHVSLRNALAASALEGELARIKRSRTGTLGFKDIITKSPRMQGVLRMAEKAANSAIPVLIEGQSGVGKELIARAIHGAGERRTKPFIAVNCGAIPDNLVESLLFGHEKGAFIGATERQIGKFGEASGGTLFLDEVGELPAAAQVKLLHAIQEHEIEPVGAHKPVKVDVRLISATNRDLIADVKAGRFREDLFYRLHVFPIAVPPLRERAQDIPELTRHFLVRFAAEEGRRTGRLSAEAMSLLCAYNWPGNVRQLENAVFRAVVLAESNPIGPDEFPQIASQISGCVATANVAPALANSEAGAHESHPIEGEIISIGSTNAAPPAVSTPIGALDLLDDNGDVRPLEDIEADAIRFAIAHYRGQMSEVARRLRIGRSTLYRKLDSLGLASDSSDADARVVIG
jgi:DNA-binding NtrC family response regulator